MKEEKKLTNISYRGEEYQVPMTIFYDPETEEKFTTTESDQEWWEDLRTQYLTRHPEALKDLERLCRVTEISPSLWMASYDGEKRSGKSPTEAIKNLYVCLGNV